ncbi:MAG: DUF4424 domain-containing protein [Gallionellaceae bacterium]|nr:DUF4424 domain-containing protein [Gallionellaceae bacterium]
MRILYLTLISSFLLVTEFNCFANDSIGAIGVGGIEFKKTDEISMEKEVLTIGVDKVRVEYDFLNKTDKTISETVLFPMPLYDFDYGCSPEYSGQLQQFRVQINNQDVYPDKTIIAKLKDGTDVTAKLRKIGLDDKDIAEYRGVDSKCGEVNMSGKYADKIKILFAENLVDQVSEGAFVPGWRVAYIYYWKMTFPPMKIIHVAHEYRPFTGTVAMGYEFATNKNGDVFSKFENSAKISGDEDYCMDDGAVRLATKIQKIANKPFVSRTVKYILSTGANWAGPIKEFTLNIKKRSKDEIVTLCFDGDFKKSNDLTLSSYIKNFLPTKEINVKFYFPDDARYSFPYDPGSLQHY